MSDPEEYDIDSPEGQAIIARHKAKWLYVTRHTFGGLHGWTTVVLFHRWQFTYWPGAFRLSWHIGRLPRLTGFHRVD